MPATAGLVTSELLRKMKLPDRRLSQAEMEKLDKALESDLLPEDCMDPVTLDGFFTALAVGPVAVLPVEWFRVICGTRGDTQIFTSSDEAKRVFGLTARLYIDIEKIFYALSDEPGLCDYDPLLAHSRRDVDQPQGRGKKWWALVRLLVPGFEPPAGPYLSAEEWCAGFYRGFDLQSEAWKPLCEDPKHADLLVPIFWFINENLRNQTCAGRDPEAVRQKMRRAIAPSVKAINIYWRMREENIKQERLDRFQDECRQILLRNTPPGKERQEAIAEYEREVRRLTPKTPNGPKSRKAQQERALNTALKAVLVALGDGTPSKLRAQAPFLPKAATAPNRMVPKPKVEQDEACPCGSRKTLKECCNDPLSAAEMDELDRSLRFDGTSEDCRSLGALSGFFTALAIGPVEVLPDEWLPVIWGTRSDPPSPRSAEERKHGVGLLLRFFHGVERTFSADPEGGEAEYEVMLPDWVRQGGRLFATAEEWCAGFYLATELKSEDWDLLCEDEEKAHILGPIFWFADKDVREKMSAKIFPGEDPEAVRPGIQSAIATSVLAIRDYWRARQEKARQETGARFEPGTQSRPVPEAARSAEALREKGLIETVKALVEALGDLKPAVRTTGSPRLPKAATSSKNIIRKPEVAKDESCPCGSGKTLKECCKFVN
jgi:uncharacterized protein